MKIFSDCLSVALGLVMFLAPTGVWAGETYGNILTFRLPRPLQSIDYNRESLEKMPHTIIKTTTPWSQGVVVFEGVLLRDLLKDYPGVDVEAVAINAYRARIPAQDINRIDVIVAYKVNGQYPKIREKGPYWIVYPRDQHPEIPAQELDQKMVWQLREIRVSPDVE